MGGQLLDFSRTSAGGICLGLQRMGESGTRRATELSMEGNTPCLAQEGCALAYSQPRTMWQRSMRLCPSGPQPNVREHLKLCREMVQLLPQAKFGRSGQAGPCIRSALRCGGVLVGRAFRGIMPTGETVQPAGDLFSSLKPHPPILILSDGWTVTNSFWTWRVPKWKVCQNGSKARLTSSHFCPNFVMKFDFWYLI